MSDYGHDPTETAIPYRVFKRAGYTISFATQNGSVPSCDKQMLEGVTQKLLGANADACNAYSNMVQDEPIRTPESWSDPSFSFKSYDILFFPGGHEKSVRQVIESTRVQELLLDFWPLIERGRAEKKAVAGICHGVLAIAATKRDGRSVLYNATTTTLPGVYENTAYYSTRLFLGDYYKTFGAGSENCEDMVRRELKNPETQFKNNLSPGPFVTEDEHVRYLSGRYPADAELLAQRVVALFA